MLNKKYKHWNIGTVYHDHKRNLDAVLVAVSPYKNETGVYLDFRYINTSKYIRQNASKALSRFEATDIQVELTDIANNMPPEPSLIETVFTAIVPDLKTNKKKSKASKNETLIDWTNVIRVDFILRKRIY